MKILVIDDHVLIRDALSGVLQQVAEHAAIVEAASRREARERIAEGPVFDLVTLDLNLPDGDGFELLAELRERHPAMSVVVLSAHQDRETGLRSTSFELSGTIDRSRLFLLIW
jgi:DNA-binding NarL/FixJ family response regulator